MPDTVRLRFAPSPTGYLHIGGARTALFNWLFARRHGGIFVLRIEDTDEDRNRPEWTTAILDGLRWLGIDWDEGPDRGGAFAPYFQSERKPLYRSYAERLASGGHVYRCFCTRERLDEMRKRQEAAKQPPRYDGLCRALAQPESERRASAGEPFVLRLRVPEGETVLEDLIRGRVAFRNETLSDEILVRSDGTPVYNLCVVADDSEMRITHVLRGEEHLSNTPKQLLIYAALGLTPPRFGHIPLILNPDGSKMSKRNLPRVGDRVLPVAVEEYRKLGYSPEAIVNFLALMGWSFDDKTEIFNRAELVERFSLERVGKSGSVFNPDKLDWFGGMYIRKMGRAELTDAVLPRLVAAGLVTGDSAAARRAWLERIVASEQERLRTFGQIVEKVDFYFRDAVAFDEAAVKNLKKRPDAASVLRAYAASLASAPFGDLPALEAAARAHATGNGLKFGELVHPIRAALTGRTQGPGLFDIVELLGREECVKRLAAAAELLEAGKL